MGSYQSAALEIDVNMASKEAKEAKETQEKRPTGFGVQLSPPSPASFEAIFTSILSDIAVCFLFVYGLLSVSSVRVAPKRAKEAKEAKETQEKRPTGFGVQLSPPSPSISSVSRPGSTDLNGDAEANQR
jgi:hypothetical protein